MCLLAADSVLLAEVSTCPQNLLGSVEDLFNCCHFVGPEVLLYCLIIQVHLVVSFEIKDPEGIKVRVHRHVQCVALLASCLLSAVVVVVFAVTLLTTLHQREHKQPQR